MRRNFGLLFLCATMLIACQIDDGMYTSYDVYYETAFATDSTNAVLGTAAKKDSLKTKSDVRLEVKGGFEYVAGNVIRYGHCWVKGKDEPVINGDGSNCVSYEGKPDVKESFCTTITGLESETQYSIRSFVVIQGKNGKELIGYNPETLVVVTDTPHDKWFESNGFVKNGIIAGRTDVLTVTTVVKDAEKQDTLTFFGMGRAGDVSYSDLWCYSSHKKTFEQIPEIKNNSGEVMRLWGAVGFGINCGENENARHVIYVGCGCTRPSNFKHEDYNKNFFMYDIDRHGWQQVSFYDSKDQLAIRQPFQGEARTGGVGFSICNEWGFVGLGEFQFSQGSAVHYHTDFYIFMMSREDNGQYIPESGYFNQMTSSFSYGARTGASVVVIDENAFIIGGKGESGYYDDVISCHFTPPVNSRPDSYLFQWAQSDRVVHFKDSFKEKVKDEEGNEKLVGREFSPRAFGAAFAVGDDIFYGMGEGVDTNGNLVYFSDMLKVNRSNMYLPILCSPYSNVDAPESRVSRAMVLHGGDRAFVVGGAMQGEGDSKIYSNSEWVYRP